MKQEVRRGRKFVEYHDPDTQDKRTFTQEISGADVSYQDEGGAWQQLVEDWETDGAGGFSFRASRMNHKVRFDSIGAWRWYPRRNVETEYLVINRPQCWLTATKRWGNLLVNGISREGKDITLTSLRNVTRVIHSRWNGIKTDWILLNANAPTRFRQKIDLVGITEVGGVLFGADGQRLGVLMPTSATDANGAALPCAGSYSGGYIEFSADVSGAAYPVTIDPDFATTSTAGDTRIVIGSNAEKNYGATTIIATGRFTADTNVQRSLFKFDVSSINGTATSVSFDLFIGDATYSYKDTIVDCYGISAANGDWIEGTKNNATAGSGEPCWEAKKADGSGGVTTAWAGSDGLSTAGTDYVNSVVGYFTVPTVSLYAKVTASINATLINSWISGNNYGLLLKARTETGSNQGFHFFTSEYATEAYRPVLTVTYTAASAGNPHYYYAQL